MDKKRDPISKIPNTQKQTQCFNGGVAQMVEQQPSKCEVLSSNHSTTKKKKKRRYKNLQIRISDEYRYINSFTFFF
jgi:hypothetical protein